MKTLNFYKLILLLSVAVFLSSCVQDDDFDTPDTTVVAPDIQGNVISINALYDALLQEQTTNGNNILRFEETNNFITGYVVSSDEGGNFFEELVIQDAAENPTRGVRVLVDVSPLFTSFEFGRKVFIKLDGLTVGFSNSGDLAGNFSLGVLNGTLIDKIPEAQFEEFLIRDVEVATIVAKPTSIADFNIANTNTFIQLNDVQFNRNIVLGPNRQTFAGEPSDLFDGERLLESCSDGRTATLSTSTFADFKSVLLPDGRGNLSGVLTTDFEGDNFIVSVNSPETINFDSTERCDPDVFNCTGPSGGGTAFFSENFEAFNAIEDYEAAGWTNVNVGDGSLVWEIGNFSNSNYAQISGFNSGEDDIQAWLVTPSIDMDNTIEEELNFNIQAAFDNGLILSVLVSTNFTGDVTTADWSPLDANIPVGPASGFGDFTPAGPINVSCIDGTVNFAFLYEGNDPDASTRYHIDDIVLTGN
ncbi:hypothetical protein ULMS_02190 [Patiriisocius marinistellae]|uniref:DUF5689 domain-containing protein n=1 Tax=Patiriisocius marinistellae TaxID=2494560 RepID=A0A5J4FYG2_9FLAO|nr:DUF5689 domain-containing protein [Patiriisocius marinistellae]GEQ84711.1 hypothetical protein ULMS_02190 [Patiriisocius marinistellae]